MLSFLGFLISSTSGSKQSSTAKEVKQQTSTEASTSGKPAEEEVHAAVEMDLQPAIAASGADAENEAEEDHSIPPPGPWERRRWHNEPETGTLDSSEPIHNVERAGKESVFVKAAQPPNEETNHTTFQPVFISPANVIANDSRRLDILVMLPDELSIKCLQGLGPKTLSRCSMVSKAWHAIATDDTLWKPLCQKRWASKKHTKFGLHPRVNYLSLLDRLSVREIKDILNTRKVDIKGVTEKAELRELVKNTTPRGPNQDGTVWPGKWKASFVVAELDASRVDITKEELCTFEWTFRMNYPDWPENHLVRAKFNRDYTYESDLSFGQDRKMSWRFYMKDIQVEQYPPLHVRRAKDWGYILDNGYAIFHSYDVFPKAEKTNEADV
ncbi:hypothetical protein HDU96_008210 [Phlyctochytrium bullatum]|nr:hypothetical protein HDU96_008210 [Phlyctochytrium bullatum]